ncbi:MAG TPA: sulfite exporter TauE/SafE family protein [Candidatus Peribacteraceae bacterium]|nr:sulfite exporter TauE/SafE family protein [Candidatus Peribacteraceae bacterium]
MPAFVIYIGIFLIGVAASVIGSMVGGGSLLSIPFLIFLGLPPQVAIATDRFGSLGTLTALLKFWKAKKIVWKYVPVFALLSLAGSLIGANILLNINTSILQKIIGVLLFILLPIILFKKHIGVERGKTNILKMIVGVVLYFLIQVLAGFFGGGTGTLIFYTLMMCFGLTIIEANATQTIPVFILYISSLIIFGLHGIIDYAYGFVLMAGMATGGYIGAHIALTKGNEWVKRLFFILVLMMGVKLLFFS